MKKYPNPPYPPQSQHLPGEESLMKPLPDYGKDSYKGSGRLQDKVALITGGDSGIGRAVALAFAREGADVIISYLSEHKDAEQIANDIKEAGRKAILVPGDIAQEEHCKLLVDRTIKEFGKLDILVSNAAFQQNHQSIIDIPSEEFEKTFKINIFPMFYLCKATIPIMKEGGSIIATASIQGIKPSASLLAYASTKGAIITFTKSLAEEVVKKGIRVNAVAPGPVWTPFIPATADAQSVSSFGKGTVFGRTAQPAELAPVYVLLASDEASYITGQVYGVTGMNLP
jgi:NAD(P)-dependent dehydrogenase (short-subunit alcohol dehydrogenase family)